MKYADTKKDKAEYIERFNKFIRPRTGARGGEKLLNYLLKSDFFTAPASAIHHLATEGGLCRHSLNVDDALSELMLTPGTIWNQYASDHNITRDKIATVALLHDICKVHYYIEGTKNQKTYDTDKVAEAESWQRKKDSQGEYIWETVLTYEVDDQFPIGHGEKSLYMISQYIDLTKDEIMAIRWHMGFTIPQPEWKSLNAAMDCSPFVIATHMADLTATHLMEDEENGYEVKEDATETSVTQQKANLDSTEEKEDAESSEYPSDSEWEALGQEFSRSEENEPTEEANGNYEISDEDLKAFADMLEE